MIKQNTMDFYKTYNNTNEETKLKFLDAIIRHNDKLQNAFVAYTGEITETMDGFSYSDFSMKVEYTQAMYRAKFEKVDTENPDWDNYHPPHSGYIPDYEAFQYASEQELEAIFDDFKAKAIDKIIEQNPGELLAMFTGLFEATQNAEIKDDVCSFDDVNNYLLSLHAEAVSMVTEKIRLSAISENSMAEAFETFFQYCNEEYPGNPHFPSHFEPLLVAFADKSEHPQYLLKQFKESGIEPSSLPELTLFLNKASGNMNDWLQSALQFYKHSEPVAQDLLKYYLETDIEAFVTVANELFKVNEHLWATFLQHYIMPQHDKALYIKVFLQLCVLSKDIQYYHKIKEYLSKTDIENLLAEIKWNEVFTVKILEAEQRFEDIKTLVERAFNKWHFAEMIEPIMKIYPDFCFNQIKDMSLSTLQTERGRNIYELIVEWLKLAQKIPRFETDTLLLIKQLYTHKPNLPALKDEMRKAGLVKEN
jgi:hypothetical protein